MQGMTDMGFVFALVLLGCADDGTACHTLSAEPRRYASKALCEAEEELVLSSDVALRADFPTVETRCVATSAVKIAAAGLERQTKRLPNLGKASRQ